MVTTLSPVFKRARHRLGLLLAALRGQDQQQIEYHHDDHQRQEGHQAARRRRLHKKNINMPG